MISPSQERRKDQRLKSNIPLKISTEDIDVVTETRNLSRSGVYCRVNKYIAPMTKLKIHLLLSFKRKDKTVTKKISCQGIIVRTESVPGENYFNVAIFFSDIKVRDAESIVDYINNVLEQQAAKT